MYDMHVCRVEVSRFDWRRHSDRELVVHAMGVVERGRGGGDGAEKWRGWWMGRGRGRTVRVSC